MQYYDEMAVEVLHVGNLDVGGVGYVPLEGKVEKLQHVPQSEDFPVTGLKGLREQLDMLLASLKAIGLMERTGCKTGYEEDKS